MGGGETGGVGYGQLVVKRTREKSKKNKTAEKAIHTTPLLMKKQKKGKANRRDC